MVLASIASSHDCNRVNSLFYSLGSWYCPICHDTYVDSNMIFYNEQIKNEIIGNTLFLKFVNGIT